MGALKRSQRNRNPDDFKPKRAEKEAVKAFKLAASEAKDAVYEEFCQEVSKDRALFKFWNLYRYMARKRCTKNALLGNFGQSIKSILGHKFLWFCVVLVKPVPTKYDMTEEY